MPRRVCVIGAGVSGLSTALHVQQTIPDVSVTIVTKHVSPNTTSDGSGGFWFPYLLGTTPQEKIRKWSAVTFEHLLGLSRCPDAAVAGVFLQSGCYIFREKIEDPFWKDIPLGYRHMTEKELALYPGYKFGFFMTNASADMKQYLVWLYNRFQEQGGKLVKRKVESFHELADDYDVVVNCSGLGARNLCGDTSVVPTQGQLIRVHAPWIKHFLGTLDNTYILLGSNCVVLGGSSGEGNFDTRVQVREAERIWTDCCKLIPSLKHAKHLGDWVGLRPTRPEVRLDSQEVVYGQKIIKVVHNYGHGGAGVTLHWGCAQEAAKLVKEALDGASSAKL